MSTAVFTVVPGLRWRWTNWEGNSQTSDIRFPTPKVSLSAREITSEEERIGLVIDETVSVPFAGPSLFLRHLTASMLTMPKMMSIRKHADFSPQSVTGPAVMLELLRKHEAGVRAGSGRLDGKQRLERWVTLLYHFQGSSSWQSLFFMVHLWWRMEAACFQNIFKGRDVHVIDPSADRNVFSVLLTE